MQCPDCDQNVLVQDGTITPHLNPQTLQPCEPKKKDITAAAKSEAKTATKAVTKAAPAKKTSK